MFRESVPFCWSTHFWASDCAFWWRYKLLKKPRLGREIGQLGMWIETEWSKYEPKLESIENLEVDCLTYQLMMIIHNMFHHSLWPHVLHISFASHMKDYRYDLSAVGNHNLFQTTLKQIVIWSWRKTSSYKQPKAHYLQYSNPAGIFLSFPAWGNQLDVKDSKVPCAGLSFHKPTQPQEGRPLSIGCFCFGLLCRRFHLLQTCQNGSTSNILDSVSKALVGDVFTEATVQTVHETFTSWDGWSIVTIGKFTTSAQNFVHQQYCWIIFFSLWLGSILLL